MMVKSHVLISAIFSLVLFIILPYGNIFPYIIIFLSATLIDLDHYFYYIAISKNFNILKTYPYLINIEKKYKNKIKFPFVFHSLDFLLLFFILGFFNKIFLYIFIGLLFHNILDIIDFINKKKKYTRYVFIIYWIFEKIRK